MIRFRYMPKGMYIDARVLGPQKTAKKMSRLIRHRELYYKHFKFHSHYVFHAAHDSVLTDPVCTFCAMLNDKRLRDERRVYQLLTQWWNGDQSGNATKEDYIIYYNTSNNSLRNMHPKVHIGNPNQYASPPEEISEGPFLSKVYNYFFEF